MLTFDPSQRRVLELDPARHARVLGAPGSGKTQLIIEVFTRLLESGWRDHEVLILATNRQVAAALRSDIERRTQRALGGTPVRTAASLAFALLKHSAATSGEPVPRLLTGTAHDEVLAEILDETLVSGAGQQSDGMQAAGGGDIAKRFSPEVLRSDELRAELREFMRVLDDFSVEPRALVAQLAEVAESRDAHAHTQAPPIEMSALWRAVLPVVAQADRRLARTRPHDLTSSGFLRAATRLLRGDTAVDVPRLIIIDDAQELREGELALISAYVRRGSRVWVFGDPDIATGAFQGEHTRILSNLDVEVRRKLRESGARLDASADRLLTRDSTQTVVLTTVHRHAAPIRRFVQSLTRRIGTTGAGEQREADSGGSAGTVRFAQVSARSEQIGAVAHRLRQRRLGIDAAQPLPWGRMSVVCRSRGEAAKVVRQLAGLQVPAGISTGGIVLREYPVVHDLVQLLRHALGIRTLEAEDLPGLLTGTVGGIDRVSLRRLRGEMRLQELRDAQRRERSPRSVEELLVQAFMDTGAGAPVDSAAGRAVHRLGTLAAAAAKAAAAGATPRETLWAVWEGTKLAPRLQEDALAGQGLRADDANRTLDAVLGLFFVLQRHEEQDSTQEIADVLDDVLSSSVPEDSLAARGQRDTVAVTTPQGVIGREFDLVCLLGPQDGDWPNLRSRGSLLGVTALEQWLRGMPAAPPARRDTLHDELRLFAQSCSRAVEEVFAVAVRDEDHHPSPFFGLGAADHLVEGIPTSRLTLRGTVAQMRRKATEGEGDREAEQSLALLSQLGIAGAHPDEWYGARVLSTDAPLTDLDADPEAAVVVRPSHIETAERCSLSWVIQHLGGSSSSTVTNLGTILHRALEQAESADPAGLIESIDAAWHELDFEAHWESSALRTRAEAMARGIADYLREFEQSDRDVVGREARFAVQVGRALIVGSADRLERRARADGTIEVTVVDLKSGQTKVSAAESERHIQMQAYQVGILQDAFTLEEDTDLSTAATGGARLLYVHPRAVGKSRAPEGHGFIEMTQPPLTSEKRQEFAERVRDAAHIMAGNTFTAHVEHHCSDRYAKSRDCRIHIIPAVSRA